MSARRPMYPDLQRPNPLPSNEDVDAALKRSLEGGAGRVREHEDQVRREAVETAERELRKGGLP